MLGRGFGGVSFKYCDAGRVPNDWVNWIQQREQSVPRDEVPEPCDPAVLADVFPSPGSGQVADPWSLPPKQTTEVSPISPWDLSKPVSGACFYCHGHDDFESTVISGTKVLIPIPTWSRQHLIHRLTSMNKRQIL